MGWQFFERGREKEGGNRAGSFGSVSLGGSQREASHFPRAVMQQ